MDDKIVGMAFGWSEFLPLSANGTLLLIQKYLGRDTLPLEIMGQLALGALLGGFLFWVLRGGMDLLPRDSKKLLTFLVASIIPLAPAFALAMPRWIATPPSIELIIFGHGIGLLATFLIFFPPKKLVSKNIGSWAPTPKLGFVLGIIQSLQIFPGSDRQAWALLYFRSFGMDLKKSLLLSLWTLWPLLALNTLQGLFRYPLPDAGSFLTNTGGAALAGYLCLDIFWRLPDKLWMVFILGYRFALIYLSFRLF